MESGTVVARLRLFVVLVSAITLGCGQSSGSKAAGSEGGACYGNGSCNSGLTCASNLCVKLDGGGGAGGAAGTGAGAAGAAGTTGGGGALGTGGAAGGKANGGAGGAPGAGGTSGASGSAGGVAGGSAIGGDSVLANHKNLSRDGVYVEAALTKSAAAGLHKLSTFVSASIAGAVYAQPLFVDGGAGGRDLVLVATEANNVYALDGNTGAQVWMRNLGAPVPLADMPCGNIDPFGITGTPVIDAATGALFVDAMTSPDGGTTKKHLIFALSVADGSIKAGWPVDVGATVTAGAVAFSNPPQSQRAALAVLNGTVYVPFGGLFGDCGSYHGWLLGLSTTSAAQTSVWATSAQGGGVWGPGGVASDGTSLYITTGNTFGVSTTWGGGEGLFRFTPGAGFATPAYWAPSNWYPLDQGDEDLGGSGPVLFDLAKATPSKLAVALGKDGNAYLLDRNNLVGVGSPVATAHAATNEIINAAAVYTTALGTYVAYRAAGAMCTNGSGTLATLKIVAGTPPTFAASWCASPNGAGSPIVTTSDGHSDAIVWMLGAEGDNLLHGYDGDTGAAVFTSTATPIAGMHRFNSPIAAKGRIYVAGDSGVVAFTP